MNIQIATENIKLKFLAKPTHLSLGGAPWGARGAAQNFDRKVMQILLESWAFLHLSGGKVHENWSKTYS